MTFMPFVLFDCIYSGVDGFLTWVLGYYLGWHIYAYADTDLDLDVDIRCTSSDNVVHCLDCCTYMDVRVRR